EKGTERSNWLSITIPSSVLPPGDGEPFFMRYADLGDGWVLSATNQNLWRFRPTDNDAVQFARLTSGPNPTITGCGTAAARTRSEKGTERSNWLSITIPSSVLPPGDGEPFFMRYADLGDGWVLSATNQNLWRFRPTDNDAVQFARLTSGPNPTITGCGTAAART